MSYFEDKEKMGRVVGKLRSEFLNGMPTVEIAQEFPGISQHSREQVMQRHRHEGSYQANIVLLEAIMRVDYFWIKLIHVFEKQNCCRELKRILRKEYEQLKQKKYSKTVETKNQNPQELTNQTYPDAIGATACRDQLDKFANLGVSTEPEPENGSIATRSNQTAEVVVSSRENIAGTRTQNSETTHGLSELNHHTANQQAEHYQSPRLTDRFNKDQGQDRKKEDCDKIAPLRISEVDASRRVDEDSVSRSRLSADVRDVSNVNNSSVQSSSSELSSSTVSSSFFIESQVMNDIFQSSEVSPQRESVTAIENLKLFVSEQQDAGHSYVNPSSSATTSQHSILPNQNSNDNNKGELRYSSNSSNSETDLKRTLVTQESRTGVMTSASPVAGDPPCAEHLPTNSRQQDFDSNRDVPEIEDATDIYCNVHDIVDIDNNLHIDDDNHDVDDHVNDDDDTKCDNVVDIDGLFDIGTTFIGNNQIVETVSTSATVFAQCEEDLLNNEAQTGTEAVAEESNGSFVPLHSVYFNHNCDPCAGETEPVVSSPDTCDIQMEELFVGGLDTSTHGPSQRTGSRQQTTPEVSAHDSLSAIEENASSSLSRLGSYVHEAFALGYRSRQYFSMLFPEL